MALVLYFAIKRGYPRDAHFSLKEFITSFRGAILALVTPLIIVGGIVFGLVTPTEASMVAVIYSLFLGMFIYRTVSFNKFVDLMLDTAKLASIVLFAVGAASIYGWVLAYYKIPNFLVDVLGGITTVPSLMLLIFVGIFLIVGTFMDSVPAIVILGPLLAPIAEHVGIHPLHFAIVGVISLAFGLVTPPYGLCLLISSEIAGINAMRPLKEVGLFLLTMVLVLVLIIFFPSLTLAIPKAFMPELFL